MKRLVILAVMTLASCSDVSWMDIPRPWPHEVERRFEARRWESLVSALSWVESRDDDGARNGASDAVGRWQMRRIYVDEVNRILERRGALRRYTYEDRTDPVRAREMFDVLQGYHNPDRDIELAIRLHRGLDSPKYRQAVLNKMEELL